MAGLLSITTGGNLSVGFGTRACKQHGKGYAVILKGSVLYGPRGMPQRPVEIILTAQQALQLANNLTKVTDDLLRHLVECPQEKLLEAP